MDVSPSRHLLLLDLDGVVVFEAEPPLVPQRELLRLHEHLPATLGQLGLPVVVLTHRSRREAKVVLNAAGLPPAALLRIVAAEDLFVEAIRRRRFGQLLRGGLQKSLALSVLERDIGIPRRCMAIIDDRLINLNDLLGQGVGLALHAPCAVAPDQASLISFDFPQAADLLARWTGGETFTGPVALGRAVRGLAPWQSTGLDTSAQGRHVFNRLRRMGFRTRTLIRRIRMLAG